MHERLAKRAARAGAATRDEMFCRKTHSLSLASVNGMMPAPLGAALLGVELVEVAWRLTMLGSEGGRSRGNWLRGGASAQARSNTAGRQNRERRGRNMEKKKKERDKVTIDQDP
jgi:hypothetical protein